jgi:two-component system sensor histidine kinase HydH
MRERCPSSVPPEAGSPGLASGADPTIPPAGRGPPSNLMTLRSALMVKNWSVGGHSFIESLKAYVGFDDSTSAALAEVRHLAAPHFTAIIDDFYDTIEAHQGARSAITGGSAQIQRLKQSLLRWIDEVFRGPHDDAYFERRARIGRMHVRINLPQAYMFTAMDRIRVKTSDALRAALADTEAVRRAVTALDQILDIELAIMLETYREDLLIKNRTAERLATIGQFAAGIGHELRNPLGVVESSAFLLRQRLGQLGVDDPGVGRHLDKITAEVQRSNKTISDLLELARSRPPRRRRVAARPVLEQIVTTAALPPAVKVTVDAPDDVTIDVDPDQLGRVIGNLLLNASQAMQGNGSIQVEARRNGAETQVRVSDSGPGVTAEVRHRIFEALFTTKAKGSGLGLALCRRVTEAHGGTIDLEPSERGATFVTTIPDEPPL